MSTVLVRRWTRQEYERMVEAGVFPPGERMELVDGEVLKMTPQGSVHATAVRLTEDLLRVVFGPGHDVRVQMPLALDPSSEPEPDGWVYRSVLQFTRGEHISPLAAPQARVAVADLLP